MNNDLKNFIIKEITRRIDFTVNNGIKILERDDYKLVCKAIFVREEYSAFQSYVDILQFLDKDLALEMYRKYKNQLSKMDSIYWKAVTKLKEG